MPSTQQHRAAWDALAADYDRFVTPLSLDLAGRLLDRVDLRPAVEVLDVACGSGALAITAARRGAAVVAVDLAPAMIERLTARAHAEGLSRLDGRVMDGQHLELEDDTFDVAVSLNGVSEFPDVVAGLRELARVTRPDGRVLVAALGPPQRSELLTFLTAALRVAGPDVSRPPSDPPPPPFQLADPATFHRQLAAAGLTDVRVAPVTWQLRFASARRFWDVVRHSHPVGTRLTTGLTAGQVHDVQQVLDGMFRERSGGSPGAVLSTVLNVGSARRSGARVGNAAQETRAGGDEDAPARRHDRTPT